MKTILVPVDFSDVTLKVVKAAVHLAKPFQSRIILMHAAEVSPPVLSISAGPDAVPLPPLQPEPTDSGFTTELSRLQEMITLVGLESEALELPGPPVDLILSQAETSRVDLIVLGSHARGPLHHLFTGSVVDGILKRARCPVLVVPSNESAN